MHFEVLLQRQLITEARGRAAAADFAQAIIISLIVGSLYYHQMAVYTTQTLHERLGIITTTPPFAAAAAHAAANPAAAVAVAYYLSLLL